MPDDDVKAIADKDASRFRKTYSYYRQSIVEVSVVKSGSTDDLETVPESDIRPRDMSRFQKAYSFTRQQPVRIRLFRR